MSEFYYHRKSGNVIQNEKEFEELGIEAKRESLLANYKVIAMYCL